MAITKAKYSLIFQEPKTVYKGWVGWIKNNETGKSRAVSRDVLVEEFYGEQTWERTRAFDSKEKLIKRARRMAGG